MEQNNRSKAKLTSRDENYAEWYLDVAKLGEMYENSPTPGCMTFLPKAVSIWESIKDNVGKILKNNGVQDIYLPLLIPMSFLEKEKDHVEGFSPELAVVTHAGGKKLQEDLAIRPTSETLFCDFFKKRLATYRDLPMLYNQWVNVMRWEKRTRPFLRTAEFYWQEGHTLHETEDDALNFAMNIHNNVYIETIRNILAIEGIAGEKSESERFAGALNTFTYEGMMSNGWALQMATSHMLSQGFMEQFEVSFQNREGKREFPYYTSWGVSTRLIGAMISSHSDNKGLIIPPKLSEYKAIILPIYTNDNISEIDEYVKMIGEIISGSQVKVPVKGEFFQAQVGDEGKVLIDNRKIRLGEKINDFELSGYPIRIDCGEKEMKTNTIVITSRITGKKISVPLGSIRYTINEFLEEGQEELLKRSKERLINNTVICYSVDDIGNAVKNGKFALYEWDGNPDFEKLIKEKFSATIRCIPFEGQFTDELLSLNNPNNKKVVIARNF